MLEIQFRYEIQPLSGEYAAFLERADKADTTQCTSDLHYRIDQILFRLIPFVVDANAS